MQSTASIAASSAPVPEAGAQKQSTFRQRIARLRREPLLEFLAIGALIFLVAHLFEHLHASAQRRIVVDAQLERRIVQLQEVQTGIPPDARQLGQLVENYIDDEVMYREALRMGLDQQDEIIRRRLIQKLEFLQRDLATAPAVDDTHLRAYYDDHAQRFAYPPRVAFTQLYFSPERGGWAAAEARAQQARRQLDRNVAGDAEAGADAFPLQTPATALTRTELVDLFGAGALVEELFAGTAQRWSAPVRSSYGWHLVRIDDRSEPTLPRFEDIRSEVRAAYLQDDTEAAGRRQRAELRSRYEIVRADAAQRGPTR